LVISVDHINSLSIQSTVFIFLVFFTFIPHDCFTLADPIQQKVSSSSCCSMLQALSDLLVRQKQVTFGLPAHKECVVTQPISHDEIVEKIEQVCNIGSESTDQDISDYLPNSPHCMLHQVSLLLYMYIYYRNCYYTCIYTTGSVTIHVYILQELLLYMYIYYRKCYCTCIYTTGTVTIHVYVCSDGAPSVPRNAESPDWSGDSRDD